MKQPKPVWIPLMLGLAVGLTGGVARSGSDPPDPLPDCEWCGADEAPDSLGWTMQIAGPKEPGARLVITGTVYEPDGTTPAGNVLVYAYHTNHRGIYATRGDETGNGRRHGYLRGWLLTGADGRFEIRTIRPAPYPGRSDPAHIHLTVKAPGATERWVDSVMFEDDPLLTETHRGRLRNRGGPGIVALEQGPDGVLRGRRDLVLDE
jgi:protocatechuate 3,4-dioxygenase beta subunit